MELVNKFKLYFILLLMACVVMVSIASVSADEFVQVTNFTEMNNTISDGKNVILANDIVIHSDENLSDGILINRNTTVDGNGKYIDGNGFSRFFKINNSTVTLTLKNIVLKNGYITSDAGVIYSDKNINLKCIGCVIFSNNTGGAINSKNGMVKISGDSVKFYNNQASNGGAICSEDIVNITTFNVEFSKNRAIDGDGGAIWTNRGVFINCNEDILFCNNAANGYGGAIYSDQDIVNIISLTNVTFFNNKAIDKGGAIYVKSKDVIFKANNVLFKNNTAIGYGGAIYLDSGLVNIISLNNVIFCDNNVISNSGGAIWASMDVLINCDGGVLFSNNTAIGYGGAIYSDKGMANITSFNDILFCGNKVTTYSGGAICVQEEVVLKSNSNILFYNNIANSGGALRSWGGMLNITSLGNLIFKNNKANDMGGAIRVYTNVIFNISGCILFDNNTAKLGGAVVANTANINNAVFYGNNANNGTAIVLKDFKNSNLNYNYWGLNYKNNESIIKSGLIAIMNDRGYIICNETPNNWILLNIIKPVDVVINKNNTFQLLFKTVTDGKINQTYNFFNGCMLVKLNCHNGTIPNYAFAGESFNYITNETGTDIIDVINLYSGDIIASISFGIVQGKEDASMSIKVDNIIYGDNVTVIVSLFGVKGIGLSGDVVVTVAGKDYIVSVVNGIGSVVISTLDVGNYTAVAFWNGTENYNNVTNITSFNVGKADAYMDICIDDVVYGDNVTVIVSLFGVKGIGLSGDVVVTVAGKDYLVSVVNGTGSVVISTLDVGNYTAVAFWNGTENYNNVTNSTSFKVNKISKYDMNVTGNIISKQGIIKVILPSDATGNVTIMLDKVNGIFIAEVINGIALVSIPNFVPDTYTVEANYYGDNKYNAKSVEEIITFRSDMELVVSDLEMYCHDGSKLVAFLVDSTGKGIANKTVTFIMNGKSYNRITDNNGEASITINLDHGKYNVCVTALNMTKNVTVAVYSTVIGTEVTKIYHNDTQYYAYFCNVKGEALINKEVIFNINGVLYTRTTNASGIAKLNINLNTGKYILTAINPVTSEMWSNNITVISTIQAKNITKMFHNDTQYKAQFFNTDGTVLANTNVTFNINSVIYTKSTDKDGYAILNINLNAGNYTITAYNLVTGELVSNNIEVKPLLVGKDLTKFYGSADQYEVTAYDSQGNLLAGANITININGVFYNRITDNNGIAHLNINLYPGEYIATAYCNNFVTSNKITILEA